MPLLSADYDAGGSEVEVWDALSVMPLRHLRGSADRNNPRAFVERKARASPDDLAGLWEELI